MTICRKTSNEIKNLAEISHNAMDASRENQINKYSDDYGLLRELEAMASEYLNTELHKESIS